MPLIFRLGFILSHRLEKKYRIIMFQDGFILIKMKGKLFKIATHIVQRVDSVLQIMKENIFLFFSVPLTVFVYRNFHKFQKERISIFLVGFCSSIL